MNLAAKFQRAQAFHQQGQLAQAQALYEDLLARDAKHVGALKCLGAIAGQTGNLERAEALFRRVTAIDARDAAAHNNRGMAQEGLGHLEAALASYDRAIAVNPDHGIAHFNRGNTLGKLCRWEEALSSYESSIRCGNRLPQVLQNCGIALGRLKRWEEALASFDQALAAAPGNPEVHIQRGMVLVELGMADDALASLDRGLRERPSHPQALRARGAALIQLGRWSDALDPLRHALGGDPGNADLHYELALALQNLGQLGDAETFYRSALALRPDWPEALMNLGNTLTELNRLREAIEQFDLALAVRPGNDRILFNQSVPYLLDGQLSSGWRCFESRSSRASLMREMDFVQRPLLRAGQPLDGRTVLLRVEQGLGDTLQFCRYAPLLAQRGATVILEVQPSLRPLVASLDGVAQVIAQGEPIPEFDCWSPLLSLPSIFDTQLETIPAGGRYLRSDPALGERCRNWLPDNGRVRVGFAWRGNPLQVRLTRRNVPLDDLVACFAPGIEYVCLQKEVSDREAEILRDVGATIVDLEHFGVTAAICDRLDLVVTTDTSVAHLAGALGRPTWVMLAWHADWRWLVDREDSPWYDSIRLLRQSTSGNWRGVLERVAHGLAQRTAK